MVVEASLDLVAEGLKYLSSASYQPGNYRQIVCVCVCVCARIHICIDIYIYREREGEAIYNYITLISFTHKMQILKIIIQAIILKVK